MKRVQERVIKQGFWQAIEQFSGTSCIKRVSRFILSDGKMYEQKMINFKVKLIIINM